MFYLGSFIVDMFQLIGCGLLVLFFVGRIKEGEFRTKFLQEIHDMFFKIE